MYKINDYVIYKRDVCIVKDIKHDDKMKYDYYVLAPIEDKSLLIDVPTDNKLGNIRSIISSKEANELINKIPQIEPLAKIPEKMYENAYKKLLTNNDLSDLVIIIKTTYLRNENRVEEHKKVSEKDKNYFELAEKLLYDELAIALNKSYDEIKTYIINSFKDNQEN